MNLNLADAALYIYDRVFDGDDLHRLVLDLVERAVERGRFPGAGRPGDENDAMGSIDQLPETAMVIGQHTDVGEVEDHARLVQKTHDNAFAMQHGNDGNAHVNFAGLHAHFDTAVLRQTLLGNVEPGHDLDTADDGRLKTADFRRQGLGLEKAVDTVTNVEAVFVRLNMEVAGALVGRLDEDLVHQLDDRGLLGHLGQLAIIDLGLLQQLDAFAALLHHGGDRLTPPPGMGLY